MLYLAISIAVLIAIAILFQLVYVYSYHLALRRASHELADRAERPPSSDCPEVAVVLCLRGLDPTLAKCLAGLTAQTYPNYQLHVAVDDQDDPAAGFTRQFAQDNGCSISIHKTDTGFQFGSLKCQGLVQLIAKLPDPVSLLALIDADAVPDAHWLEDLVSPLIESHRFAATTGNRWFHPSQPNFGSLVCKIWNAAAIVQMLHYNIAWGGSLAIRREAINQANLLPRWASAFCEDTMLHDVLRSHQLRLKRLPGLIIQNNETSTAAGSFGWIARQLLNARLYHRMWPLVIGHALLVLACIGAALAIAVAALVSGTWTALAILATAVATHQILNLALVYWIEQDNARILRMRNRHDATIADPAVGQTLVAMIALQFIHPVAALHAQFMRTIKWRGIRYRLKGPQSVEIEEFRPYAQTERGSTSCELSNSHQAIH